MTHFGVAGARARPADLNGSTLPSLLASQAAARPAAVAFMHQHHGIWHRRTWRQVDGDVATLAGALAAAGVGGGDTALIAGANSPRLTVAWLATLRIGAVPALAPQPGAGLDLAAVAAATRARIALVGGVHDVNDLGSALPELVVFDDPNGLRGRNGRALVEWDSFIAGKRPAPPAPGDIAALLHAPRAGGGLASLRLTHADLIEAASAVEGVSASDRLFAALPFGWGEPLALGPVLALLTGAVLGFAESDATMLDDWRAFGPTLIGGPVSFYSRIRDVAAADVARVGWPWRRTLARGLGFESMPGAATRGPVTRLLLNATRDRLGLARTRRALVHGDALAPDVARFWSALGLPAEHLPLPRGLGVTEQVWRPSDASAQAA